MDLRESRLKVLVARSPVLYRRLRSLLDLVRFVAGRPHEEDFEYLRDNPHDGLLLDVGANNGVSALSLRSVDRRSPILSIEPSVLVARELRLIGRVVRRFEFRTVAAGAERGELALYTPFYRGTALTGEARTSEPEPSDVYWFNRYVPRPRAADFSVHRQQVQVLPLDDLGVDPVFVKIDVEVGELDVLRGLSATLTRCRPTIMIEQSAEFEAVSAFLRPFGYLPHVWDPRKRVLRAHDGTRTLNIIFVIRQELG